jgi:octaprenyl-diphosphate synthase
VEFSHNASLVHDDIEDASVLRRGKPAIHCLYGEDTAINSGSFLYFLSTACIDTWDVDPEKKLKAYSLWASRLRQLHFGQSLDISWHRASLTKDPVPSVADYELMCKAKTGTLAELAVRIGALAAGFEPSPNPSQREGRERNNNALLDELAEGALNLGLGFQILDDVKNLREGLPGKQRGDDIVEGKRSLPIIIYLKEKNSDAAFVEKCFQAAAQNGLTTPETEQLIEALEKSGAIEEAKIKAQETIRKAEEVFNKYPTLEQFPAFLGG